ncbi:hypothetical protein [Arcticibacter svalbardensis]|uniref:hypothetical protein n=1 Tax=Arcticibacter svalbardensis TaxID=1288027 RepID=UPI00058E429C|nr:hypothetical protein [Arcticibacter svalbardensis]
MPLSLYPVFLLFSIVLFYIIAKRYFPEKDVEKTTPKYSSEPVSIYANETQDQFYLRCHIFITDLLVQYELGYHTSNDLKSHIITYNDGYSVF